MKRIVTLTGTAALWALAGMAQAHHSFAMFDSSKEIKLDGTIKSFEWTNPHSWIWITVSDGKGGVDVWGAEGMTPNYLSRRGWTRHTVSPGDKVVLTIYPVRDGSKAGQFVRIQLPDGRIMTQGISKEERAAKGQT
jgi:hypothetical protein